VNVKHEMIVDDEKIIGWAKAHNNEPLQIVCGYHALPVPPRGGELVFRPLEHLQPVKYSRPGLSLLGFGETILDNGFTSAEINKVNARLAAAEEALALSIWTTATVCRALSLESVCCVTPIFSVIMEGLNAIYHIKTNIKLQRQKEIL